MKNFIQPDARGWIGIGCFVLVLIVLAMMKVDHDLLKDDFFKTIATLIIGSFWGGVAAWAYSATKSGGDLTKRTSDLLEKQSDVIAASAPPATVDPAVPAKK